MMVRFAFWRGFLAVGAVITAALLWSAPGSADSEADRHRVDQDLARTQAELEVVTDRARQAVLGLHQATAALPAAQAALEDARGHVLAAQVAARRADRESAGARAAADRAAREFDQAAARVNEARREVSTFVAATYRGSSFTALNAVLESGSPSDFVNSVGYLDRVADSQREALDELTAARMVAKQRSDVAENARGVASAAALAAQRALDRALAARDEAERAAVAVQTLADQKTQAAATAESERAAVLIRYQELRAASARIAEELRLAAMRQQGDQGTNGGNAGSGPLLMPVAGWLSSEFGMRYDPYYHVWQLHAGTDYAAAGGSPIYAAAGGSVIRASWNGGYGNYTCLYHGLRSGRGLSTCYAHQSAILVSPGQWVEKGQIIGRVGTTGASTGCHLHFEVRLDGTPVNPRDWLG
jgi:murein DD-endopeptidase MepM/ murein hydrolase activator NlpD